MKSYISAILLAGFFATAALGDESITTTVAELRTYSTGKTLVRLNNDRTVAATTRTAVWYEIDPIWAGSDNMVSALLNAQRRGSNVKVQYDVNQCTYWIAAPNNEAYCKPNFIVGF